MKEVKPGRKRKKGTPFYQYFYWAFLYSLLITIQREGATLG